MKRRPHSDSKSIGQTFTPIESEDEAGLSELSEQQGPLPFQQLGDSENAEEGAAEGPRGLPIINWESNDLKGRRPLIEETFVGVAVKDQDRLPEADIVVMTWTSAEWDALHYVFSNGLEPLPAKPSENAKWRETWRPYRRDFYKVFQTLWTRRLIYERMNRQPGAPALAPGQMRWGSYCMVRVGKTRVLLFKSDLHLNQDGEGLPLITLVEQIIEDARPGLILSTGTSGGTMRDHILGDTVVTNAAKFRLSDKFQTASFNNVLYTSKWTPPKTYLAAAENLLIKVDEYPVSPPTSHFNAHVTINPTRKRDPKIHILPAPILTTDYFEFGTTTYELEKEGCCVEMGDAVIAMVCASHNAGNTQSNVEYGFLRNISDPVINANLPRDLQVAWAVRTYQRKGLLTSFNSAIATWAMIP
jgi:nucleoside phosphorylase